MQLRNVIVLLLLFVLVLFGVANWETISARTPLNLLFAQVEAPFGLLMLIALGSVTALFAMTLMVVERRLLRDAVKANQEYERRRQGSELSADELRKLTDTVTRDLSEMRGVLGRLVTNVTDVRDLLARRVSSPGAAAADTSTKS